MSGRPNSFMPMFWGDYWRDTGHLTGAQHGAYLNLIGRYWVSGRPLPDDDAQLWRLALCDSIRAWVGMRHVVLSLFHISEDGWRHKRIDAELLQAEQRYAKRSNAAAIKWSKQKQSTCNADAMHDPMHVQPQPQPQPHLVPNGTKIDIRRAKAGYSADFEMFWRDYPRKIAKGAAWKAWQTAIKVASAETIIASLNRKWPADPAYIPHPATYLNQRRWEDEIERPRDVAAEFLEGLT